MNAFLKRSLVFLVVIALVGVGGMFGRKAYKKAVERRLILRAGEYLQTNDVRNATLCLQRAMQVNPFSVPAAREMADLLDSAGVPAALSWRERAVQLEPNNPTNRFLWAQTALRHQDLESAAHALSGVDEKSKSTAAFHKLAGALAWALHSSGDAENQYKEALRLEPNNPVNVLNLDTIHLASTNQALADAARRSLEQIPSNSPLRSTALQHLLADAEAHTNLDKAIGYSKELIREPAASFSLKIVHLDLLRQAKRRDLDAWLLTLKNEASTSPSSAFLLGQWMASTQGPTNALRWLDALAPSVRSNQPVPLIVADCHLFMQDWRGLHALLASQEWAEAEFFRLALDSLAQRGLGQNLASQATWGKAVRLAAHRLDRLSRLTQLSAKFGWSEEYIALLRQITSDFPRERWAADQLIAQFYSTGKSRELAELVSKIYASDPSNARIKNNFAAISLLRKTDLTTAYRLAREAYDTAPNDPFCISTYAYALLLQHKTEEAAKVAGGLRPEFLKIPSVAAYYGVIEAQTGHKDAAREPLQRAATAKLLPEEMEIVRLATASL